MTEIETGAAITPESAQKALAETEEAKKEEPEVKEPQKELDKPEDKEPEKTEPEEPADPEPLPEKKRSIYTDLKEKRQELRDVKLENEAKDAEIARLQAIIDGKKTPEDKPTHEVSEDIVAFAESIGAEPDAIEKLDAFLKKRISDGANKDGITKEDVEFVRKFRAEQAEKVAQSSFESEWKSILPQIKTEFPTASEEEIENIRKEIDKLAHSKFFHDKDIDYVFYKSKGDLSKLVSPKRPSIEGGANNTVETTVEQKEITGRMSPLEVENIIAQNRGGSSLEIRSAK